MNTQKKTITANMPVVTEGQRKMSTITFEEVDERPKLGRGREKRENEFLDVVKQAAESGKTFKFQLPLKNEQDEKALRVTLRLLSEAGEEFGKTVSKKVDPPSKSYKDAKRGLATVVFWTREKIRHTPKDSE